jgi:hypothetical protein
MEKPMARRTAEPTPEFYEATTTICSEWIELNALDEFPTGVCRQGTVVKADHPIVKAHGQWFEPFRADVGDGGRPPRNRLAA